MRLDVNRYCCFLRIRRPPRATRTDTLFPYTTLFRSDKAKAAQPIIAVATDQTVNIWSRPPSIPSVIGNAVQHRSEEHTSELQSLMRISSAVFCLKKNPS